MKKYVVHKTSRLPGLVSYAGITFDHVGWDKRKDHYDTYEEAMKVANELGKHNPVGFTVSEASEEERC